MTPDHFSAYTTLNKILDFLERSLDEEDPAYSRYLLERQEGMGYTLMQILGRIQRSQSLEDHLRVMSHQQWSKLFFTDVRDQTYMALDDSLHPSFVIKNLQELRAIMIFLGWHVPPDEEGTEA